MYEKGLYRELDCLFSSQNKYLLMQENKMPVQRFSYLFERYQKGICSEKEANEILHILENTKNDDLIKSEISKLWNQIELSNEMSDTMDHLLEKVHYRIINVKNHEEGLKPTLSKERYIRFLIRAAAILFLPLLIYSAFLTKKVSDQRIRSNENAISQTITVPAGVQTNFLLPDGSNVWLNSGTVFKYPNSFKGDLRQVEISGEGFFDVVKDPDHPFLVKAGNLNIEVKGTRFDVINYPNDDQIEVILESGQVCLLNGAYTDRIVIGALNPGEKATISNSRNSIEVQKVFIEKYTSWKNGLLIFRDDPMVEVVRKLSHKYNVDFELQGSEISDYVYTATFTNESLLQILELLKISSPIKYKVINQNQNDDKTYSRSKIIITQIK